MMQGGVPMSEPISVSYLDLDRLIETCGLTESQRKVVDLLMKGWTEREIADEAKCTRDRVTKLLKRAVSKIIAQNDAEWHRFAEKQKINN